MFYCRISIFEGSLIRLNVRNIFRPAKKNIEDRTGEIFNETLKNIKDGDEVLRNEFISSYIPFILKVTSKTVGKYIDVKNSDEYSIALSAFNESINSYNFDKNYNFFLFSEQVIKRRLIDYSRKSSKQKEYPFSYFEEDYDFNEEPYLNSSYFQMEEIESRESIMDFCNKLREYDITLMDLTKSIPKHKDSRKLCIKIARELAEDDKLYQKLIKNKSIPRNELKKRIQVHNKTIGNNRKYIIAICLIIRGDLQLSQKYLQYTNEGGI
ncbi:MAG: RNA polymerase sigma-I factor [Clostridiaceae bacterium]|jgi:RNA polymerase sigma factor|nr:RNA polymerase sigma-I factor [Clostridiaceae bacterium]